MRHGKFVDMRWIAQRMRHRDDRINRLLAKEHQHVMTEGLARINAVTTSAPAVTPDHLELVKATIAKDATPAELQLFLYDCARQGVHPLDKLIHFTKRSNKYTPVTSIDFLRIRAADSGECAGIDEPIFSGTPKTPSFAATVTVWRLVQGQRYAFTATARWSEYVPDQAFMWNKMPHTMLGKCAEALALRKGFPKQLSGLYVREEMAQAENTETPSVHTSPAPARVTARAERPPPAIEPDRAAPANQNDPLPDAWKPFVTTESLTGTIVAGKRSKTTGKTTFVLDTGEEVWTLDRRLADELTAFKEARTPVTIATHETPTGKEIVTIAEATDAAF
jgi:phage recombination protein Bet